MEALESPPDSFVPQSAKALEVLLVTTWGIPCGIAEHSAMLKEAVEAADSGVSVEPFYNKTPTVLHPGPVLSAPVRRHDILHLNYHAALHSQWTPEAVRAAQAMGYKVVVTYHDTYAGTPDQPNSEQCKGLHAVAEAFVVHEPVEDLPGAICWRQGVPESSDRLELRERQPVERLIYRPLVGTIGFPLPWKNYDLLLDAAAEAGWQVLLFAPGATEDQLARWGKHPGLWYCYKTFNERLWVIDMLRACDATAFLYTCHNAGTSGAVRMGIAARKPVVLMEGCRQFRDLDEELAFYWTSFSLDTVAETLSTLPIQPFYSPMVRLAEQDSWRRLGQKYAALYRSLLP